MATKQQAAKFIRFKAVIYWAQLAEPNELSGKYEFKACNLNDKTVEAFEALGCTVNVSEKHPEMGQFVVFRSAKPMKAVDEEGDAVQADIIGNGSEAIITAGSYDWKFKNKTGTSATLKKLIITKLEEYAGGDVDEDEVEETL